jgi:hypothetical protein
VAIRVARPLISATAHGGARSRGGPSRDLAGGGPWHLLAQLGVRGGRAGADWHRGGVRRDWTGAVAWCAVSWTTRPRHGLHQTVGYGLKHVLRKRKKEIRRDNDG